jgi:PAS domain S-box-containing protein
MLSVLIFLAVIPFARVPLAKVVAFIPTYESALAIIDLITAVILFSLTNQRRSSAFFALACGYFFSATIIVPHMLSFPEVFSDSGLLGANDQTTAWLYVFWHGGFPLFALLYAVFAKNNWGESLLQKHRNLIVTCSVACILAIVAALTLLATAGDNTLPIIMKGGDYSLLRANGVSPTIFAVNIIALIAVLWRRELTALDVWLVVVLTVYVLDVLLSAIVSSSHYDLGWYTGCSYQLIASCSLLVVLLLEFARLPTRLFESEQRYRLLVSGVKDYAILMLNPEGLIVSWNEGAERLKGYKADEIIGQHFSRFYPPDALAAGKPALELLQAVAEGKFEEEGWRLRKDNSRFWANVLITPVLDEGGELRGFSKVTRDITARKTAETLLFEKMNELTRSNEESNHFASVAAHDLQEPLRMVSSYLALLSSRYKGKLDSNADEFIAFAMDGTSRMQRLIQDLLTYSRFGTGCLKLHNTSSENALRHALVNLRDAIEASGALVTHDPLPSVMADEAQLTQLFQNLVGNAIKYQKCGIPRVHVSAVVNGDKRWKFSVRDNGIGIDSNNFEKIFGMFQRLHKGEEFEGTGIGLAICKKIVERHGGNISVDSQSGQGSNFQFDLAESTTIKVCNDC